MGRVSRLPLIMPERRVLSFVLQYSVAALYLLTAGALEMVAAAPLTRGGKRCPLTLLSHSTLRLSAFFSPTHKTLSDSDTDECNENTGEENGNKFPVLSSREVQQDARTILRAW